MKFLLTGGNHYLNGRAYKAGDTIITVLPLDEIFKRTNKFKRIDDNFSPVSSGDSTVPATSNAEAVSVVSTPNETPTTGMKLVQNGGWFDVVDQESGQKMNEKALRKKDAIELLKKYSI